MLAGVSLEQWGVTGNVVEVRGWIQVNELDLTALGVTATGQGATLRTAVSSVLDHR
jgi:hypothetical protein